jgi:hypothetical protein
VALNCARLYGSPECPNIYAPPPGPGISVEDLDYGADALQALAYAALVDPFTAPATPFLLGGSICLKYLSQAKELNLYKIPRDIVEEEFVNPFFKPVVDKILDHVFEAGKKIFEVRPAY